MRVASSWPSSVSVSSIFSLRFFISFSLKIFDHRVPLKTFKNSVSSVFYRELVSVRFRQQEDLLTMKLILWIMVLLSLTFLFMSVTSQIYNNIKRTLITLDSSDSQGLVHVLMWNDQGLSWNPRVFYLPNFATKQQCEAVIDMAKPKLKPSTLALRKGETAETTQNVRTRLKKTYIRLNS